MSEIDNLEIRVTSSADDATNHINTLASAMDRFKGKANAVKTAAGVIEDSMEHVAASTETAAEGVEEVGKKVEAVAKQKYTSESAGVFVRMKKDTEVLNMRLNAAQERLAKLLNADNPNNNAIASATAQVKRLQEALSEANSKQLAAQQRITGVMYTGGSANIFAYLKTDADVLKMKLDAASERLAELLNAPEPNNNAIASATAEVRRLQSAYAKTSKAAKDAGDSSKKAASGIKDAGEAAKRSSSGLSTFWQSLKRIAYYRFIRSIIKEITSAFKEGITNLYHWSDAVNGHFAQSMDKLATSTLYLKNSLGAMVSPLIESFIPILDVIIDKVVDVLNFFNMLVSAVSGADTYTVAKKAAAVWDDSANKTKKSAKSTANELKRTILGFDEINKLVKQTNPSSSSGSTTGKTQPDYASMFEERPLTGFFKKLSDVSKGWPNWLKWLLGGAALIGGFKLIKDFIPWLLKKLRELFGLKLPNWLDWLFNHGKNGGALPDLPINVDVPEKIDLPTADLPVKLSDSADDLWKGFKNDWDETGSKSLYFTPKMNNKPKVLYDNFKDEWDNAGSKTLYFSPKLDNRAKVLYDYFMREWDEAGSKSLYFSPKMDNRASVLYNNFKRDWDKSGSKTLYFTPKLNNSAQVLYDQFKRSWEEINRVVIIKALVKLEKDGWVSLQEWSGADEGIKVKVDLAGQTLLLLINKIKDLFDFSDLVKQEIGKMIGKKVTVDVQLRKKDWTSLLKWMGAHNGINVKVGLKHCGWDNIEDWIGTAVTVAVALKKWGWTTLDNWTEADKGLLVKIGLLHWGWDTIANYIGTAVTVAISLSKYGWYWISDWIGDWSEVYIYLQRGNFWSLEDWLGNQVSVRVNLRMGSGGAINTSPSGSTHKSFGGATGNGGGTVGGGVGRVRHNADGGIFSNGIWSAIQKYAGGTNNAHGSLFLAGEAGPEIVGHIGGRTEVLNKSQLAAAMYSAVHSAMSGITIDANIYNAEDNNVNMDALLDFIAQTNSTTERQNELLRQQNEYLRQLNDKEFTAEVTSSSVQRAMNRTNRRAGVTVMAVGPT